MNRRDAVVVAAASAGVFLWILDAMVVTVALADVRRDLGAGTASLQWVVDVYAVTFASLMLFMGAVADRLGPTRVYLAGLGGFLAASLACAAAPGIMALLVARAAEGAAAAAVLPSSLGLLREAFPEPGVRARAIGAWSAISGIAGVTGPVLAGALVDAGGWRLAFLLNVPLCLAGAVVSARVLPRLPRRPGRALHLPAHGALVALIAGLVLLLIETPHRSPGDPVVIAGAVLTAAAAWRLLAGRRSGASQLLPLGFFSRRTVSATTAVALLHNLGGWGAVFVLSVYFQTVHGWSALETGIALLPMPATMAALSLVSGRLVRPLGARTLMTLGMAAGSASIATLALVSSDGTRVEVGAAFAGLGLASGLTVPAMTAVMLVAVRSAHASVAGAVLSTARQMGTAVGVAAIGALAATTSGVSTGGLEVALSVAAGAMAIGSALALTCVRRLAPRPAEARHAGVTAVGPAG